MDLYQSDLLLIPCGGNELCKKCEIRKCIISTIKKRKQEKRRRELEGV